MWSFFHFTPEIPSVSVSPNWTAINVTGTAEFVCTGSGTPKPRVSWETGDLVSDFTILNGPDSLNQTLIISNARQEDTSRIECSASNYAGKAVEESTLLVYCK